MRLGIMQPYFWPYLEHFRLLNGCDRWVVFDTVAYRRKTWMTRNRILNRDKQWSYISVPVVKATSHGTVAETAIDGTGWRDRIADQLQVYANEAPFFDETLVLVQGVLERGHTTLAELNTDILRSVARHLDIETPIERLSEMGLTLPDRAEAGEWALLVSQELGASEYRNPAGGVHLFDPNQFSAAGIDLTFHQHRVTRFPTGTFEFVPDLSIIDPLMWCGRNAVGSWARRTCGPCD
jgi:hypothetical protein